MTGHAGQPDRPARPRPAGPEAEATPPAPRRRRRRWAGAVALGLVLVLGVLVPRFAAGWLAKVQLDRMGIANQGVTSLDIDLWNSEIDLGTVEFWSADAEHGRIENVSLVYDLGNLFASRALVDRLRIRGIDIRVTRDEDGSITVNGIELTELLGPEEGGDTQDQAAEEDGEDAAFGVGLDGFLLEASRMVFETEVGGTLMAEIDRLVIEDMRSWDPDHPAVVSLTARVNDIELEAEAQAHLFSDTIMVDAHVRLDSIDLDKVTRFTGPLGFERRDGEIGVDLAVSIQIEPDGRMVMAGYGNITHEGAELVRSDLEYRVAQQRVDLDAVLIAEPVAAGGGGDASIVLRAAGDARIQSRQVEVNAPKVGELTFDEAEIDLANLAAVRDPQGRITLEVKPTVEVSAPVASGPAGAETDRVALAMSALAVTIDGDAIALRAAGAGDVAQARVSLPGPSGGPGSMLSAGFLRATFDDLSVSVAPDRSEIAGRVGLEAGDLAGSLSGAAEGGPTTIELDSARAEITDLDVGLAKNGRAELSGRVKFGLGDLVAEASVGEGTAAISAGALDVVLSALEIVAAEGGLQLGVTGTSEVAGVELQLSDGPRLELGRLASDLDAVDVAIDPTGRIEASGGVALTLAEAAADMSLGGGAARGTVSDVGLTLTDLQLAMSEDGGTSLATSGSSELETFQAALPAIGGRPPATITLAGLGIALHRMAAEVDGDSPRWELALSIEGEAFDAAIEGDGAGLVRLGSLSLEELEADQTLAVGARSLKLAGLEVELTDRTIQALAGGSQAEPDAAQARSETSADGAGAVVRVDKIGIERPAVVRYADTSVEPPFEVETELGAEIARLDSADPSQRTDLRIDATINQKAELALSGWATSADPPDFDLALDLRDLQLPSLSPYAANAVGMDIESGVLGTTTVAVASGGALEGNIDLEVEDLILIPISEAAAEEASAAIGVPVSAVVGLLEDSEGRIVLGMPIAGTVEEPQVDPTEAISKAVAAALTSVFPPTAIAGMLMSESGGVEFRPITFEAGSAELDDEGREVIDGFVALLNAKPRLEILPCGRATPADAGEPVRDPRASAEETSTSTPPNASSAEPSDAASDAMLELAKARALAVETYLVEEQGLAPERVRECRPRYDPGDSGSPRVDLTLT
jgi:hypothetical protein